MGQKNQAQDMDEKNRPVEVKFDDNRMWVTLADGRIISIPLEWYPRLANATPEQRNNYELSFYGIHWEEIDEDISVSGILKGNKAPSASRLPSQ